MEVIEHGENDSGSVKLADLHRLASLSPNTFRADHRQRMRCEPCVSKHMCLVLFHRRQRVHRIHPQLDRCIEREDMSTEILPSRRQANEEHASQAAPNKYSSKAISQMSTTRRCGAIDGQCYCRIDVCNRLESSYTHLLPATLLSFIQVDNIPLLPYAYLAWAPPIDQPCARKVTYISGTKP